MATNDLTIKQEKAYLKYIECGDKSEAYRFAYNTENMKPATINRLAFELFENPKIRARVEKELKKRRFDAAITQERILEEEKCLSYFDPAKLFELKTGTLIHPKDLPEYVRRAIVGLDIKELRTKEGEEKRYKFKYKFSDKGKSLERISRHLGMYNDKLTHSFDDTLLKALQSILPIEYYEALMTKLTELTATRKK